MRDLARLLAVQAINAADDGRAGLAAQSVLDGMALAQSLRKEPVVISQLVRIACWGIALDALEQVVNRVSLDDRLLVLLQGALARADDREAMTRAFQGELCIKMSMETETPEEKAAREEAAAAWEEQMQARQAEEEGETPSDAPSPDATATDVNADAAGRQVADGSSGQAAGPGGRAEPVPPEIAALFHPNWTPGQSGIWCRGPNRRSRRAGFLTCRL